MTTRSSAPGPYREVRYRYTPAFVDVLRRLEASLLVSTYQAGKLVVVGADENGLRLSFHNFEQAMGLSLHPRALAVGSRGVIWFLQNAREFAARLDPPGRYDACYLARQSFITGHIHAHEMAWVGDELWIVNTLFSCLCTLDERSSFVPRWQPPFVTELAANDRCHLNGLALTEGRPAFVTVLAETDSPAGWRAQKASGGCILEVPGGQCVSRGLSMPHSPRVHAGRLWVLNSGHGSLELVDPSSGRREIVVRLPGYTRGLAFTGDYAFVGLSRIRETAVFGGLPIAEEASQLKCGVGIIDVRTGHSLGHLEFEAGVEEIFDVALVPAARSVALTGPYPAQDDAQDVWIVPWSRDAAGRSHLLAPALLSDAQVGEIVQAATRAQQEGRRAEAVEGFRRAASARPGSPLLQNSLGNALQDLKRQDEAQACYEKALELDDNFAPAHQNLGQLLIGGGRLEEGRAHFERAQQLEPNDVNRVILATALPIVYGSAEEIGRHRQRMLAEVEKLLAEGVRIEPIDAVAPTNFFAAYQGLDDCDLQRKIGRLYAAPQPVARRAGRRSGKLRVGFLSSNFRDHTIGRLNLGRVRMLDRQAFDVTLVALGHNDDPLARQFHRAADRLVVPAGTLDAIRKQIAELDLDLLLFADVGMNAMTYTLAMSRLAGVQCVTWGHPVTTGFESMDYFVSGQWLETPQADAHYTERLVRLANLGTYYYRPRLEGTRTREHFGLDPSRHLYVCPQTLFKMHPEFDAILADILRRDPAGDLVLLAAHKPGWTQLLQERFARTMPDVLERVRFLPMQPHPDFLHLCALADVVLDPIHFGGGNTSYEGLALGTPIVTLPGSFLRSRITYALYRKMEMLDCVVETPQAYVELALRLGTDQVYRAHISGRIEATSGVLFEDPAEVRELERFLQWAAEGGGGEWNCQPAPGDA